MFLQRNSSIGLALPESIVYISSCFFFVLVCLDERTDSRVFCKFLRGLRPRVSLFYTPEIHFTSQVGKMSSRTTGIRIRHLLLTGQMR